MTIREILKKAVYIQFPLKDGTYKEYSNKIHINKLPLTPLDMYQDAYPLNNHHVKPIILFEKIMPYLGNLLNFSFNKNDFIIKPKYDGENDISMPYPINNKYKFDCVSLFRKEDRFFNIKYDDLMVSSSQNVKTEWHKLYKFGHECSVLINKTIDSKKRLLIIGDSQMIPLVTMMSIYFKNITYIDNRSSIKIFHKIRNTRYTNIIIQLFDRPLEKYYSFIK